MTIRRSGTDDTRKPVESAVILVVDDHPANLIAMRAVLDSSGHEIVTATSGAEALRLVQARDFVLIVMDVHMPGLDGYDTTALIRQTERASEVPIVFLTAVDNLPEHVHRAYALGAVDYITKPFDPVVLRAKVEALVSLYLRGQRVERERSQEYERMKDLFFGAVGHDLRGPLNSIVMASGLMRVRPCSEPLHETHCKHVERAARRMDRIIEDILDLARGQFAAGMPIVLQPVDLGELCRSVVGELQLAHRRRTIEVSVTGGVGGLWDPGRLARVVSNLVGNALAHGQDGPVRVRVRDEGEWVALEVRNRGAPIAEESLPELFEPFRRGKASRAGLGLGLGLFIVREIVRGHGGRVEVASEGDENVFTVRLPRTPPPAA